MEYESNKTYFYPKFFFPTVKLFSIDFEIPISINAKLNKSFSLFWANPSSPGDSLRKITERILDDIDEKPTKYIPLEKRIINSSLPDDCKNYLMSIKWIGNEGSHDKIELNHYDIIIAFKLLKKCLTILYNKNEKILLNISKAINKSKKSFSKIE